ncbi:MAG: PAS domain S-box protein, partial [Bacteroidota bacterium]
MKTKPRAATTSPPKKTARQKAASSDPARESLHEYQTILATAEEVAGIGSWKWDLRTQKVSGSDQMFRLFGVEREDFDGDVSRVIAERIHPEDAAAVIESNRKVLESAEPHPLSYRILLPDGTERTVWAEGRRVYDEVGQPIAVMGYAQDITERVQAEKKILQLQRLYATLCQVNQSIIRAQDPEELFQAICDVAVKYGNFSPAWIGLVNEESGEVQAAAVQGMEAQQWTHPMFSIRQEPFQNALISQAVRSFQVLTSEDVQTDERTSSAHSRFPDFPFHSLAAVPFRLHGGAVGILALVSRQKGLFKDEEEIRLLEQMGMDISFALEKMENDRERRRAEQTLRESEARFSTFFRSNPAGINIFRLSDGRCVNVNDAFLKFIGYSREEVVGHTAQELGLLRDEDAFTSWMRDLLAGEPVHNQDARIGRRSGDMREALASLDLIEIDGEKMVLATAIDITERKQVEEKLRQSEERFSTVFHKSRLGMNITRWQDGAILDVNDAWLNLFGWTREEVIGKTLADFPFYADLADRPQIRECMQKDEVQGILEVRVVRKNGMGLVINVAPTLIDLQGERCILAIMFDATERKQAEEKLRQSEERYRLISENTADIIWVLDPQAGKFTYISPSVEKLRGYTPAEIMERPIAEALTPESFERISRLLAEHLPACLAQGSGSESFITEVDQPRRDGSIVNTEVTTTLMFNQQGRVEIVGVSRDITERKRTGQILRENEERLRLSLQAANQGLYDLNVQTGEAVVNREYAEMLGYDFETFVETNDRWIERLHPDDRASVAKMYLDYVNGLLPEYRMEFRQRTREGGWKWILSLGKVIEHDPDGKPLRMLGTHTDITERRHAEEELRASEERYRNLVENMNDIVMEVDAAGNYLYVSPNYIKLSGYSAEEEMGGSAMKHVHPDDLPTVMQKLGQAFRSERQTAVYRVQKKNGEWRWLETVGRPYPAPDGSTHLITVVRDISERKRAEDALKRNEEVLRLFVEHSPASIAMFDRDMRYIVASHRYLNDYRLGRQDLTGRCHYDVFPEIT